MINLIQDNKGHQISRIALNLTNLIAKVSMYYQLGYGMVCCREGGPCCKSSGLEIGIPCMEQGPIWGMDCTMQSGGPGGMGKAGPGWPPTLLYICKTSNKNVKQLIIYKNQVQKYYEIIFFKVRALLLCRDVKRHDLKAETLRHLPRDCSVVILWSNVQTPEVFAVCGSSQIPDTWLVITMV